MVKVAIGMSEASKGECCPACTSIVECRAYNQDGKGRFPEKYKWSRECCEKCFDTTCSQHPFYIMAMLQKSEEKDLDVGKDYYEEALQTILIS